MKLSSQEPRPKQFCGNWKPALRSRAPGTAVRSRAVFWAGSTDCSSTPGTRSGCSSAKGRQRPLCSCACLTFSRSSAQGPHILPLSLTLGSTAGRVANPARGTFTVSTGEIRLPFRLLGGCCGLSCAPCPFQFLGLPWWLSGKESTCQCRRCGFDPWVRKIPLEEEMITHSSILAWKVLERGAWWATVHEASKSQAQLSTHTCILQVHF